MPRLHGKVSDLETLLFQICSVVIDMYTISYRSYQNKFEIAIFPDHRISHALVVRLRTGLQLYNV